MMSIPAFLALAMQCAATVHPDTAQDVARVESGFNPLAIGVVGQKKGIFPANLPEALAHVNRLRGEGRNFSVGLMQINQANFRRYHMTAARLFDPCTNLSIFEKIITDCYQRGGSLPRALSCYYSGNFTTGQQAEAAFRQTSYVQRTGYQPPPGGYRVPGTREERHGENKAPPVTTPPVYSSWDVLRQYPRHEGDMRQEKNTTPSVNHEEQEKNVESTKSPDRQHHAA